MYALANTSATKTQTQTRSTANQSYAMVIQTINACHSIHFRLLNVQNLLTKLYQPLANVIEKLGAPYNVRKTKIVRFLTYELDIASAYRSGCFALLPKVHQ